MCLFLRESIDFYFLIIKKKIAKDFSMAIFRLYLFFIDYRRNLDGIFPPIVLANCQFLSCDRRRNVIR